MADKHKMRFNLPRNHIHVDQNKMSLDSRPPNSLDKMKCWQEDVSGHTHFGGSVEQTGRNCQSKNAYHLLNQESTFCNISYRYSLICGLTPSITDIWGPIKSLGELSRAQKGAQQYPCPLPIGCQEHAPHPAVTSIPVSGRDQMSAGGEDHHCLKTTGLRMFTGALLRQKENWNDLSHAHQEELLK